MEELTVVVFDMEEAWGRDRPRTPWKYHVEWEQEEIPRLCRVYLPERMQKKKEWTKEGFASYAAGLPIPGESPYVYYDYRPAAAAFLQRENDSLSVEWAGFLLQHYGIRPEAVWVFEDKDVRGEDWLCRYAGVARYLGILTDRPERQEEMSEYLLEEYGIILQVAERIGKCRIPRSLPSLFVVGEKKYGLCPADVGQNGKILLFGNGGRTLKCRIPEERTVSVERYLRERGIK